jgi:hydroxymethylglutaryl-CoA lyase
VVDEGAIDMPSEVKIIECPRDAWQGLKGQIPTEVKAEYLRALIAAGFKHIDAVSFVSPKAVPQMADSAQVLQQVDPPDDVEIIAIIMNTKGAERAIATRAVHTLGFPYSISPTFAMRNQRQTLEESRKELGQIKQMATEAGLDVVTYISMAFGNPYGGPYEINEVIKTIDVIEQIGVTTISLADTVGLATSEQAGSLFTAVNGKFSRLEVGVHLHSRPEQALEKILAAFDAGCRRFDAAIGGLGGCPFAQDDKVGNMPTEKVLAALARRGIESPLNASLAMLIRSSAEISVRHGQFVAS